MNSAARPKKTAAQKSDRSLKHSIQTQLGLAAMLLLMGVGNLWYGETKYAAYARLLAKAEVEARQGPQRSSPLPFNSPAGISEQEAYINELKARMEFDRLVSRGGLGILALSFALFVNALSSRRVGRQGGAGEDAGQ